MPSLTRPNSFIVAQRRSARAELSVVWDLDDASADEPSDNIRARAATTADGALMADKCAGIPPTCPRNAGMVHSAVPVTGRIHGAALPCQAGALRMRTAHPMTVLVAGSARVADSASFCGRWLFVLFRRFDPASRWQHIVFTP